MRTCLGVKLRSMATPPGAPLPKSAPKAQHKHPPPTRSFHSVPIPLSLPPRCSTLSSSPPFSSHFAPPTFPWRQREQRPTINKALQGSKQTTGVGAGQGPMAILYSLVARGSVVLAEFSAAGVNPNAAAVARQLLEKIPGTNDSHVSYSHDRHIFHVKRTDGITVLCMADDAAGRRIPFAFLEDIHGRFVKTYGRACHTALAYAMNEEFSRILSQQMDYYTNDPNADRMNRIKGEMHQVRNVMIENIDKVLERGDRLEILVDKTANMQGNTHRFRKQARRFRNTVWWRNVKLTVLLIILILVLVYVVLAFVCHGVTLPSCIG